MPNKPVYRQIRTATIIPTTNKMRLRLIIMSDPVTGLDTRNQQRVGSHKNKILPNQFTLRINRCGL